MKRAFSTLSVFVIVSLLACGCGGGTGADPLPGDGGDNNGGNNPPPIAGLPLALDLEEGDFFEFAWSTESVTFAQPDSYSSETDSGWYRIVLGPPTTTSGLTVYPLMIKGDKPTDLKPRWTQIAVGPDGSLHGSKDGAAFALIYSAASSTWTGGGFFVDFRAQETVKASRGYFSGNYNEMPALAVSHSSASGGCEVILGQVLCSDSSTRFSESEYFKEGIGPIAYSLSISYTSSGGGFYSSHQLRKSVELIRTSESAQDGSVFRLPPWERVANLSQPRYRHAVAALGGKIYAIGGTGSDSSTLRSVEIYDPGTNTWRFSRYDLPGVLYGIHAATVGERIYVISSVEGTPVHIFDPAAGWSTGTASIFDDPSVDVCDYEDPALGGLALAITPDGASSGQLKVFAYRPADDRWYYGTPYGTTDHRWFTIDAIGEIVYVAGGYQDRASTKVFSRARRYDVAADAWLTSTSSMSQPRYNHGSAVLSGRLYVVGGRSAPGGPRYRSVESYDSGADVWRDEAPMFDARAHMGVVELDGAIYVIGGHDGDGAIAGVERFTPR